MDVLLAMSGNADCFKGKWFSMHEFIAGILAEVFGA
jgi:hypothetical protein